MVVEMESLQSKALTNTYFLVEATNCIVIQLNLQIVSVGGRMLLLTLGTRAKK